MSEVRDTPVKVFGWTITSVSHVPSDSSLSSSPPVPPHLMNDQSATDNISLNKDSKETSENSDEQHSEITTTTMSEEKTTELKKPDKILPCPRCESSDTKFCYYNNYNVNQPRHFCRSCQRYWTAGGSMRTVPVGSGRRKNKGWVSSDHYLPIASEDTDNYNNSSTKILNFESAESLVAESTKHQSRSDLVSKDFNNFQGFLPPQVTSSVSPPWPYQYPPNPSFYHMPVYWGCAVPVWSTLDTSPCLGKRARDEASEETVRESKDTFARAKYVAMKQQKIEQFSFFNDGSERNSNNKSSIPETYLSLQANPAAMARSMNFRESM